MHSIFFLPNLNLIKRNQWLVKFFHSKYFICHLCKWCYKQIRGILSTSSAEETFCSTYLVVHCDITTTHTAIGITIHTIIWLFHPNNCISLNMIVPIIMWRDCKWWVGSLCVREHMSQCVSVQAKTCYLRLSWPSWQTLKPAVWWQWCILSVQLSGPEDL